MRFVIWALSSVRAWGGIFPETGSRKASCTCWHLGGRRMHMHWGGDSSWSSSSIWLGWTHRHWHSAFHDPWRGRWGYRWPGVRINLLLDFPTESKELDGLQY